MPTRSTSTLRDQLIAELKGLNSAEQAAAWAHRVLAAKTSLVVVDAKQVELAFQLKLSTLMTDQPTVAEKPEPLRRDRRGRDRAANINKSVLALPVTLAGSRPGACQICRQAALPGVRPASRRCASSALCPVTGARPEGQ